MKGSGQRLTVLLLASLLSSLTLPADSSADVSDLTVQVSTDRSLYPVGGPVQVEVTKCNPTPSPITVTHACPCCHDGFLVLDSQGNEISDCTPGCIQIVVDVTWAPGECKKETFTWFQTTPFCSEGAAVDTGQYSLLHQWQFQDFYLETQSPSFIIGDTVDIPTTSHLGLGLLSLLVAMTGLWWMKRRLAA